ncbi:26018_t:CDS:2, partial [Dentiscutata erythropus]
GEILPASYVERQKGDGVGFTRLSFLKWGSLASIVLSGACICTYYIKEVDSATIPRDFTEMNGQGFGSANLRNAGPFKTNTLLDLGRSNFASTPSIITANHLSSPFLIGYAVIEVVVAPSGLFGVFGAISNNIFLMCRYSRDHWFSVVVLTIIDVVKIILSFTMKYNTIDSCITNPNDLNQRTVCENKVDFDIKAGLVVFGAQEVILVALGSLTWYCAKRISQKPTNKIMRESERREETKNIDMEVQESHVANDITSIVSTDILEKRQHMDQDSLMANPPSPFIRRPTQHQRQENQISDGIKQEYNQIPDGINQEYNQIPDGIKQEYNHNPNNSRIQENNGSNSNITQNTQRFDQIHTTPTHKPSVPIPQKQCSQGLPPALPSTSYNNSSNSRPPIVHRHNSMLPPRRLANYQLTSHYVPDTRPVNGNGMMFPPILNQTESISVPFLRSHKRSDSFPQPRPLPLPPIANHSDTYQVSQQSTSRGNTNYKIDQPSIVQSNEPFLQSSFSRSLPNLHDSSIIEPPIPIPYSDTVLYTQQINNDITPMPNTIYSQPKALNNSSKSFEASNTIQNSNNRNSLKRMRRKSAHSVRGEAIQRPDYGSLYNHYYDLQTTSKLGVNDRNINNQITNDYYINNSYVAHSRLTNQVFPYGGGGGTLKSGGNSKNINKQNFNQIANTSYTNNSYAIA